MPPQPSVAEPLPSATRWQWPVDIDAYDRTIELRPAEREALNHRCHSQLPHLAFQPTPALARLTRPLEDVIAHVGTDAVTGTGMIPLTLREVHRRGTAYWGWTLTEWRETLCPDYKSFRLRHRSASDYKPQLMAACYLLGCVSDPHQLGKFSQQVFAKRVFTALAVDASIARVRQELQRWGYGKQRMRVQLPNTLAEIMIAARSPYLEDIRLETLEHIHYGDFAEYVRDCLGMVSRALCRFGIIPTPLASRVPINERFSLHYAEADVPDEWLRWITRWRDTSTLRPKTRQRLYYALCKIGRWLAHRHSDVLSPADWTRELAATCVAAVDRMTIGDWAHVEKMCPEKIGQPLSAGTKYSLLGALRTFFQDCQEWGWIARRFDPRRSFATPRSIRALIKPHPKVIADDTWAKLLWAGLNLSLDDLPKGPYDDAKRARRPCYPLAMAQALSLVWLFAGLRSDEIRRLRVGCVRRQHDEVRVASSDDMLPAGAVCWLTVPANKTGADFVKPVEPAVGEAIAVWEQARPAQPLAIDYRTSEAYDCLFSYRGQAIGRQHLNQRLIPMLCRKAGVPETDARGRITSHRARSTITSQLYNAKEPMSIWDLKQWLGHQHVASTEYYVKPTPVKLAKSYTDADYFKRNVRRIDVLVDLDAVKDGSAAAGDAWKFYDLGHGYCTYDFFEQCPHRMACAKCSFYVAKASSRAQLLEANTNLQRMLQEIPLQEAERAAVEDGLMAVEKLYAQLVDVPTPAGPTPRELKKESR
ncbi:MAG: tyrosine-type recombinase/integrase [Gammaproteobacteria bacterium]